MSENSIKIFMLLGAFCLASACSSPPKNEDALPAQEIEIVDPAAQTSETEEISSTLATIVVYRGGGMGWGIPALLKPKVKLDGTPIGICRTNDKIVKTVFPGSYKISMRTDIGTNVKVTLQAGQTAFVRCTVLPIGIIVGAPSLTIVTESIARNRLAKIPLQSE
ncbi:MAG: hypothetical protein ACI9ZD_000298 [Paracoccaceae bacterium]|jgi:hypothetical protein